MTLVRDLLLGAALGAAFVFSVRRWLPPSVRTQCFATGLAVASLIYVGFALRTATVEWVWVELAGVTLYGSAAWCGWRRRAPWLIALGFILHPVWDLALHWGGSRGGYAPQWYVVQCLSFDLLVAAYVFRRERRPAAI